ncbi:MAG: hypothetical protein P4L67_04055 [Candidatus Pacebacteria bacterium]|nr:hypothetical protein [Candidatus Paceibacterota bacterium]
MGQYIDKLQQSFGHTASQPSYGDYAFLTYDDVSRLSSCEENRNNKLIIIKAQPGTVMEVPDPNEVEAYFRDLKKSPQPPPPTSREEAKNPGPTSDVEDSKYQINLKSKTSEIMVYAVENEEAEVQPREAPALQPLAQSQAQQLQPEPFETKLDPDLDRVESLRDMYAS